VWPHEYVNVSLTLEPWGRAQRAQQHNSILIELEKRLQALKMERIAAENEMQLIQVDGAGQVRVSEARGFSRFRVLGDV
jgi:hypothetical protein